MNKMLKSLLVAALTLSAAQVKADSASNTNRTFLMPRAQGVNAPLAWTTFGELVDRDAKDKFGATFEATGFWQQSTNGSEQGKYFLADNKSTIDLSRAGSAVAAAAANSGVAAAVLATSTLDLDYIIHNAQYDGGAAAPAVAADAQNTNTLSLDPRQEVWGVQLDYHQDLRKLVKGLYLHANLPVVNVENNPRLTAKGASAAVATNMRDYFAGIYKVDAAAGANNAQEALKYGKIAGKRSESGVADIDVVLGYHFLNKPKYHAGLGVAVTIPTGNKADGAWLFQPIVGNGQHFGLGGDFCAGAHVWSSGEQNLKLKLALKYRYLFENSQKRTLGLKGTGVANSKLAQYQLLGKNGVARATAQLIPAANVTTMNVDVTPGSQLDGVFGLTYNHGGFSFDAGYNMYFREAESVTRKGALEATTYGVAARDLAVGPGVVAAVAAHNFGNARDFDGNAVAWLSNDNLDTDAASTPSQFTNSIYGGAGYVFRKWDTPVALGLGAKYEWANKNSALEQWGVWAKVGVGF